MGKATWRTLREGTVGVMGRLSFWGSVGRTGGEVIKGEGVGEENERVGEFVGKINAMRFGEGLRMSG